MRTEQITFENIIENSIDKLPDMNKEYIKAIMINLSLKDTNYLEKLYIKIKKNKLKL